MKQMLSSLGVSALLLSACTSPPQRSDYLGATLEQVISELGVPETLSAGTAVLQAGYRGKDGQLHHFALHQGVVLRGIERSDLIAGKPVPKEGAYLCQPVAELARRLGSPKAMSQGVLTAELSYDDQTVTIAHGIVIGLR